MLYGFFIMFSDFPDNWIYLDFMGQGEDAKLNRKSELCVAFVQGEKVSLFATFHKFLLFEIGLLIFTTITCP